MIFYLTIFLIILIPVIRFDLMKLNGNQTLWSGIIWVLLVLLAGLRYRVGGDTLAYMNFFKDYPTLKELSTFDFVKAQYNPMWYVYNAFFKTYGDNFTAFQIVHAIIVNTSFFVFFRRYVPQGFFTALLTYYFGYYFYFNFEILREILCISILLWAFPFLERKNLIVYYLLSLLAFSFHMSAVIMFFLPLILLIKRDNLWLSIILMLAVIVLLSVVDIISIILDIAFEGSLASSINSYMKNEAPNFIGAMVIILIAIPFLIMMFVRQHYSYHNDPLIGAILIPVILIQTAGMFIPMFSRFSNYFMPFGIVFMVNTFYKNYWDMIRHHGAIFLTATALFIYCFNLSYYYLKSNAKNLPGTHQYDIYLPYHSVFDPVEDKDHEQLIKNIRSDKWLN